MTHAKHDPSYLQSYYDQRAQQEWDRLEANPRNRVNFHLHRWYLEQYVTPGEHILEVGAGAGRFTIELARLGARLTVGDISVEQLRFNALKVHEAGYEQQIVARDVMDVVDLTRFADATFDSVVCYGGPLSYVFDRADEALSELLRVTRPGGYVYLSVMSLLGSLRRFLPRLLQNERGLSDDRIERILATGDQDNELTSIQGHRCHMFRWSELQAMLQRHPCTIAAVSAANFLALRNEAKLDELLADPVAWQRFLQWELEVCQEPGALDGGTHIIAVVRRT